MDLSRAARAFDRMPCLDAYTGKLAFYGQLGLYDDSKRDSEATERRVISTAPGVPIPKRRVISAAGTQFIVGHANPDSHMGQVIRVGWVVHEAEHVANVCTLAQVCLGQQGIKAYHAQAWGKNVADNEQSSDLSGQFRLYFADGEPVQQGMVVQALGDVYVTRATHLGPAGVLVVLADKLTGIPLTQATLVTRTVNRFTEASTVVTSNIRVLRARWQSLFEYRSNLAPKFGPMDLQVVIAKASAPLLKPGDELGMVDGSWRLDSVIDEGDVWLSRAVRHG